ncbi:MAG: hypothetical protein ACE5HO_02170 [bacterium]
MAKDRSFAAKVAKSSSKDHGNHCPECGESLTTVQLVVSERQESSGAWKFNQRFVRVCKCNDKEVYG